MKCENCGHYCHCEDEADDYEDHNLEDYEQDEEDNLKIFDCICGAWVISKQSGKIIHVADCICGSSEPF